MANPPKGKAKAKTTAAKKPVPRSGKTATSRAKAKPADAGQKYVVSGTVTYADATPAAGLTVIAYDKDVSGKDTLGQATTDAAGSYIIPYSDADFRRTKEERGGADVIVCIYNAEKELLFTSKKQNNAPANYELNIKLPAQPFVVRGTVRDAEGKPLKRALVKAFDRDLRWEEPLGKTHTDQSGVYKITYTAEQFVRSEKVLADLVVRVYGEKNAELVASAIIFNASAETVVNLSLPGGDPRGLSEFDNLVRSITPLLRDIHQNELTEDDIAFLVAETGIDHRYIRWLAESARRHTENDIVDQFVFYALFRQNLPTVLNDLLAQELSTLRDALEKSSQDHVVKHLSSDAMDAIMAKLRALQADHATTPGGGTGEPSSLGDLLRMVLKDAVKIRAAAQLYIAHNSRVSGEFFDELKTIKLFNNQERIDIRLTLQLGEFTGVYLPLVNELLRMAKADSLYAPTGDLSPYARLTLDAWKEVLHRKQSNGEIIGAPVTVAGEDAEEKIANYALSLNQYLESSFPATTIVRRIEADTGDDSPFKESHADLTTFLGNNPGFNIGMQPLDIYLSTDADTKLAGVKDREAFTTTLKGIQRVSKLVPDYVAMRTLMANGLHSAQAMVAVGENFFVQKYSIDLGGVEMALATYRTAKHVQNTAMAMFMKNAPAFRAPLPYVIGGYSAVEKGKSLKNKASLLDWTKLFGSLELCECRHCRSLYSPAAYLVDTLNFISDAPMNGDTTPLQNLLVRRPDIEHIELTCDNSNTPMPYVDLVNELLEANIASRNFDLPWSAGIVAILDQKTVNDSLIADFKNQHYTLTDKASVRVDSPGLKWTILDSSWAFVILNHGQVEGISSAAWPQTSWSTKELKTNSEHTYSDAYNKLRDAVYPWRQPFNLPIEESRIYLQHLAVQKHELMAVFLRGATPDPESDFQVACEYLGMSPEEAKIINGSTTGGPANPHFSSGPWDFWGMNEAGNSIADPADGSVGNAQGAWSEVLRRVSIFLQRSGLSYRELLDLLDTYYVNPRNVDGPNERTLAIVAADDSNPITCNTAKLALYAVGDDPLEYVAAYDRAHRFVRLARKLGWAMRDLDKAISAFRPVKPSGVPDITDGFLIQLSHVQHLCVEKRVPVVNLLSLWDDIDHTQYVDHLTNGEPAISSLYAQMFISKTLDTTKFPENPAELANQKISLSIAAITAAFGIGADDVNRLHADTLVMPLIPDPANNTVLIRNDKLSLATLSQLYRHALLARIVGLPIPHYLTALRLVAANPFPSVAAPLNTTTTLKFIKAVGRIASSEFSVDDLNYLLRHSSTSTSGLAITESDIGAALDVIRADLRQIANENTFVDSATDGSVATTDPDGELTRQKLALLNWSAAEIDATISILNGTHVFEAKLTSLGAAIRFPAGLADRIAYDASAQRLRYRGIMSSANKAQLLATLNADQLFKDAVGVLYGGPKEFVARQMRRFSVPMYQADLLVLPTTVQFPNTLKGKVYYDKATEKLYCIGVMTVAEKEILIRLSTDRDYGIAIARLFDAPATSLLEVADQFLTASDADALFDNPVTKPAQRFEIVLKILLRYLRTMLSECMVKQRLGEHTGLDARTIDGLLNTWVLVPGTVGTARPRAMSTFVDPVFAGSNAVLQISQVAFPQQFATYLLLHKIAAIISKFAFSSDLVQVMFEHGPSRGWLEFNQIPLASAADGYAMFLGWSRLADLARLRDTLPHGVSAISDWLAAAYATNAQPPKVIDALSLGTEWNLVDLQSLAGTNGFNLNLDALRSEASVGRLAEAMTLLKRLRATADQCLAWTRNATSTAAYARDYAQAQDIKNLARAKYDPAQWLQLAGTLRDPLREKQRTALVDYMVATWRFKDANALYAHLLIDVEMSPCMMTTRIKQAISSVQLYVQRTLMNLEEFSKLNATQAKQWSTWRKQYRVWEANRKVLLYPENWIEPELRDDKTPFFKDLESELLQNDLTADTAEDVFINYLEKLDQVARLDIVGMYEDYDGAKKVLHVFGRTYAVPHIYFYRRLEGVEGAVWTAWEKVELDIEGDHLIPVVWNRRLHLFWALFTEKSDQPTKEERANNKDPKKYWEIKFAWSEYKNKGWSPKKISKDSLRHEIDPAPPTAQKPQDFSFKTQIHQGLTGQQLSINCYGMIVDRVSSTTIPATTTGATTNKQWIARYSKGNIPYLYWLQFRKNGWGALDPSDIRDITIRMEKTDGTFVKSLSLASNGDYPAPFSVVFIAEAVDFYLVSTKLQLKEYTDPWSFPWPTQLGWGITFDLKLWSPSTTTTTTTVPERITIKPMQGIGEFTLDDCSGNLVRVQGQLALAPPTLVPIQGTQIQAMAMVEGLDNSAIVSGAMAVLGQTPGTAFRLLLPHQGYIARRFSFPFFFQDQYRTYHVLMQRVAPGMGGGGANAFKMRFNAFFHPLMCELTKSLKRQGVDGLLTLDNQRYTDSGTDSGAEFMKYLPNSSLVATVPEMMIPREDVDFRPEGAYSQYNWELFFHAPFLIATQLSKNQRFEEAQKWFHYIFDPTSTVSSVQGPERFWRALPFFDEAARGVQTLEELLADSANLEKQVLESASKPFNPHAIARLRVVAYMKSVVMHYIDNLLAWGDQLFGRDTIESINEATQLYILAAEILGKRPESVPPRVTAKVQTYSTLYDSHGPDSLSNALVEVEGYIFPSAAPLAEDGDVPDLAPMPYFCTAPNDKLLGYWDLVADRLFKIRHCMNLAGIERSLPIYEPPIDPALLVRAAAAGVDLASALSDVNAPVPHYRFGVMLQKATELCNDVKSLGGALLSALEKRDAEALSLLRSSHEIDVLKAVRQVKEQQAKEASANLEGLNEYQKVITARQQYYQSREFINQFELTQLVLTSASLVPTSMQLGADVFAGIAHLIPNAKAGSPVTVGVTYGGGNIGSAVQAFGSAAGIAASMLNTMGSMSATLGGYQRRQEDWTHQSDLATKELKQVAKQIAAAEIRLAIAEHELENHDQQIENSQEVDAFMRTKFTNRELYNWMVGQLSAVYFQSYQLAYDVAKRAERAYRFELGLRDSNFVQFGYWDSLKKGLLSGERLHFDLKRMDVAYLDLNRREHEITKHISLAALDPLALIKLKETKPCFISLPEALFDMDHPGHYLRRLKSVSVTIPCVTGPYAGVHCTLTLLNSTVRHSNMLLAGEYERRADDIRFTDSMGAIQSIVTSSGQNDSGLFEANLRDERYLPFEGAGAISEWRLQLPENFPQFNYETISDVVLHVRYTAREGGGSLADGAQAEVRTRLNTLRQLADGEAGLVQMLSLRHEYPTEWNQLRSGNDGTTRITLNKTRFPFLVSGETVSLIRLGALARVRTPTSGRTSDALGVFSLSLTKIQSGQNPRPTTNLGFPAQVNLGDLRLNDQGGAIGPVTISDDADNAQWTLALVGNPPSAGALNVQHRALLEDIVLLVGYRI